MLQGRHGDCSVEPRRMQCQFELGRRRAHAVGTPQQWLQILQDLLGKHITQGSADGYVRRCKLAS